jgi:hypothetical protein
MQLQHNTLKISCTEKALFAIAIGLLIASFIVGFDNQSTPVNQQPEIEYYTVQDGDTLWSITSEYIVKNTYGKRCFQEFKYGIIQENYKKYPDIKSGLIKKGDVLEIHYWIKKDGVKNE